MIIVLVLNMISKVGREFTLEDLKNCLSYCGLVAYFRSNEVLISKVCNKGVIVSVVKHEGMEE